MKNKRSNQILNFHPGLITNTKRSTHALTFPAGVITKSKRSQEEMVGFVLIIIIITIIGLFFVFIMSHQTKPYASSSEVESFLESSLLYTTSCSFEETSPPYNIQDLISACLQNQTCSDGTNSCDILNQTFSNLIESAFNINQESKYKAYKLNIQQYGNNIIDLKKGNLTANFYGADIKFFTSSGSMNITLRLYF